MGTTKTTTYFTSASILRQSPVQRKIIQLPAKRCTTLYKTYTSITELSTAYSNEKLGGANWNYWNPGLQHWPTGIRRIQPRHIGYSQRTIPTSPYYSPNAFVAMHTMFFFVGQGYVFASKIEFSWVYCYWIQVQNLTRLFFGPGVSGGEIFMFCIWSLLKLLSGSRVTNGGVESNDS